MAIIVATYVDADTFTVATDRTTEFAVGRRVSCDCGVDGEKVGTILSSSYGSPNTTVNLSSGSDNLTSNLATVEYGVVHYSIPEHSHDGTEGSGGAFVPSIIPGYKDRPKFIWKDANEIYIDPFVYHHQGSVEQFVYCDSQLTYTFSALAVSDWSYLYLDDSAIVTADTNLIAIGQLIDSTTEPTWNAAKHGWYNGEDRCIFAVLTDGSSNIVGFLHENNFVLYQDGHDELLAFDLDNVWTDEILQIPSFCCEAQVLFQITYVDTAVDLNWRTNGQAGTIGHAVGGVNISSAASFNTDRVITDSNQIIEIKFSAAGGDLVYIKTHGWYFPIGM